MAKNEPSVQKLISGISKILANVDNTSRYCEIERLRKSYGSSHNDESVVDPGASLAKSNHEERDAKPAKFTNPVSLVISPTKTIKIVNNRSDVNRHLRSTLRNRKNQCQESKVNERENELCVETIPTSLGIPKFLKVPILVMPLFVGGSLMEFYYLPYIDRKLTATLIGILKSVTPYYKIVEIRGYATKIPAEISIPKIFLKPSDDATYFFHKKYTGLSEMSISDQIKCRQQLQRIRKVVYSFLFFMAILSSITRDM